MRIVPSANVIDVPEGMVNPVILFFLPNVVHRMEVDKSRDAKQATLLVMVAHQPVLSRSKVLEILNEEIVVVYGVGFPVVVRAEPNQKRI